MYFTDLNPPKYYIIPYFFILSQPFSHNFIPINNLQLGKAVRDESCQYDFYSFFAKIRQIQLI